MNPHRGAIALNDQGQPGLLTYFCDGDYKHNDQVFHRCPSYWAGIHLSEEKFGQIWVSHQPEVLDGATFHMADILESLKHNFDTTEKT